MNSDDSRYEALRAAYQQLEDTNRNALVDHQHLAKMHRELTVKYDNLKAKMNDLEPTTTPEAFALDQLKTSVKHAIGCIIAAQQWGRNYGSSNYNLYNLECAKSDLEDVLAHITNTETE